MEGERAGAVEVFWHAQNLERNFGKGAFQAPLDEMNGEMGDVDTDPTAVQFLRGMDRGAAAAERVKDEITFVGGSGDDPFEQREGFLGGIAEAFRVTRAEPAHVCVYARVCAEDRAFGVWLKRPNIRGCGTIRRKNGALINGPSCARFKF